MLKETISRRLQHSEWPYPEIMLIDGGKGQLNAALEIKNQSASWRTKIKNLKIISIAKGKQELFIEGKDNPIPLKNLPREIYNLILSLDKIKEPGVALNLIKKLNELLEVVEKEEKSGIKTNQSLLKKYQDDVTLLKFINLVGLADKEIEELFRMNLVFAIRSGIMVLDQVHHYITAYNNSAICSKFADSIIKAISYNEESLGDNQIFLETEKKPTAPQLKNWVRSYNQSFDSSLRNVILQEGEYLSTNKDVLKLSIDERKRCLLAPFLNPPWIPSWSIQVVLCNNHCLVLHGVVV